MFNQNINDRITSDLILYEDRFIIRTNKNHYMGKIVIEQYGIDEVELFYDKVTSILFRGGGEGDGGDGRLTSGTMTFVFPGKRDYKKEYSSTNSNRLGIGGTKSNDTDPYLLYFFEELNPLMKEIKDLINKKSRV